MNKNSKFFYGWWMVITNTILLMTSSAVPLSIILKPLMEQSNTGRGEISIYQSILLVIMDITGIFVGRPVQLHRLRTFMPSRGPVTYGSVFSAIKTN